MKTRGPDYTRCKRCGHFHYVRDLKGGICGSCADDLRDERNAEIAGMEAQDTEARRQNGES